MMNASVFKNGFQRDSLSAIGLMTAALVGMKLVHLISLSWFWVTSPLWAALSINAVMFAVSR